MDIWSKWIEFLACGLFALPATLGIGLGSFEAFAVTLGLMQVLFIAVSMGAPTVTARTEKREERRSR